MRVCVVRSTAIRPKALQSAPTRFRGNRRSPCDNAQFHQVQKFLLAVRFLPIRLKIGKHSDRPSTSIGYLLHTGGNDPKQRHLVPGTCCVSSVLQPKHRCKCCCLPPNAPQSLRQAGMPSGIFPWSFPLLIMRFFPFVSIHGKIL